MFFILVFLFLMTAGVVLASDFELEYVDGIQILKQYNGSDEVVIVPEGVGKIGDYAFTKDGSKNIKFILLPDSVIEIGSGAFSNCTGLEGITLSKNLEAIDQYAFFNCNKMANITLPDSLKTIYTRAFSNCSGLTEIILPNSLTYIGDGAFRWCSSLTSIRIPNSITTLNQNIFIFCEALKDIYIPESVTKFVYQVMETTITIHTVQNSAADNYAKEYNNKVVYDYNQAITPTPEAGSDFVIKAGVLEKYTGTNYKVEIPKGVTSIGDDAFRDCTGIENVVIPYGVTSIGQNAFNGCTNLETVKLPFGLTSIGQYAFYACNSLTYIEIPATVTEIYDSAFENCTSLEGVKLQNGLKVIGIKAFANCTGLKRVTIPNYVINIRTNAFSGCTGLNDIIVPDNVTIIGYYAIPQKTIIHTPQGSFAESWGSENGNTIVYGTEIIDPIEPPDEDPFFWSINGDTLTISGTGVSSYVQKKRCGNIPQCSPSL